MKVTYVGNAAKRGQSIKVTYTGEAGTAQKAVAQKLLMWAGRKARLFMRKMRITTLRSKNHRMPIGILPTFSHWVRGTTERKPEVVRAHGRKTGWAILQERVPTAIGILMQASGCLIGGITLPPPLPLTSMAISPMICGRPAPSVWSGLFPACWGFTGQNKGQTRSRATKNLETIMVSRFSDGARYRTRTCDPMHVKHVLYQLS